VKNVQLSLWPSSFSWAPDGDGDHGRVRSTIRALGVRLHRVEERENAREMRREKID
jgi:hypothetical protein